MYNAQVARDLRLWLFQRWLFAIFLVAWASLGSQVLVLSGRRGLVPIEGLLATEFVRNASLLDVPTLFRFGVSDGWLEAGCWLGALFSVLGFCGFVPRWLLLVNLVGYLSYAVASTPFLSFQWDNLLLECAFVALLVGTRGRRMDASTSGRSTSSGDERPWHAAWRVASGGSFRVFLFRVILFKLYFESGIAKYQSHLGDWLDGTAMTFYYETAPLPTSLAFYAHALPEPLQHLSSWVTLVFELLAMPFVFSPRKTRLALFWTLLGFQILNAATANYGFFCHLSLGLHVFLLDEDDLLRFWARCLRSSRRVRLGRGNLVSLWARWRAWRLRLERRLRSRLPSFALRAPTRVRAATAACVCVGYLGLSIASAARVFVGDAARMPLLTPLARALAPLRIVNTYHLFSHITRERLEPDFQTFDGKTWTSHPFRFKPGPPERPPPFVAPHQPRVDFQLWFHGLRHDAPPPSYVRTLLRRLCDDPEAVRSLFTSALPTGARAARVVYHRYHMNTLAGRHESGLVWLREEVGKPRTFRCAAAPRS